MLWCGVVTLFPEMFNALSDYGVTGRAFEQGLVQVEFWNPRNYTSDRHQTVDDRVYGGGPGMVMQVEPLRKAIRAAKQAAKGPTRVVYLSPQGQQVQQERLSSIATDPTKYIFVAGRYEGIDERLIASEVDEEWSIGDYVLSGGELATMVVLDAVIRWVPGALGHAESALEDSFSDGLLDCPHYTRPEVFDGMKVPEVLLGGDHAKIARWRLKQKLGRTWLRRKDLLDPDLSLEQQALLKEFIDENEGNGT